MILNSFYFEKVKVMNFKINLLIIFLCIGFMSKAQKDTLVVKALSQYPKELLKKDDYGNYYYYDAKQQAKIYEIEGETVVVLDEVVIPNKPRFNNQLDKNYYFFLSKKLNRVYPLFITALEQYNEINNYTSRLNDKSEKENT